MSLVSERLKLSVLFKEIYPSGTILRCILNTISSQAYNYIRNNNTTRIVVH